MDSLDPAFKPVTDCFDHILEVGFQYFLPRYKPAPPLPVRDFFLLFIIPDPALDVIEHAEALIYVAGIRQADSIISKKKFRLIGFYRPDACHAGKHPRFLPVSGRVVEQGVVDIIYTQPPFPVMQAGLFKVQVVQIDACRCVGGAEIHGHGHGQRNRLFYLKVQKRDAVDLHILRYKIVPSHVNPVKQLRFPPSHAVQAVILHTGLTAGQGGGFCQIQTVCPVSHSHHV